MGTVDTDDDWSTGAFYSTCYFHTVVLEELGSPSKRKPSRVFRKAIPSGQTLGGLKWDDSPDMVCLFNHSTKTYFVVNFDSDRCLTKDRHAMSPA